MKRTIFKQLAIAAALGTLAVGSAFAAVTARLGHAMPESHPQATAMNKFAELAGKYTNNNVQIKAFQRLYRNLGSQFGVFAQIEKAARLRAGGFVFGQIAAGLAHHPHRRVFHRLF